jgi:ribonuclease VapC
VKLLLADAPAILAYLGFETGSDAVADHLADLAMTSVNLAEIVTVLSLRDIKTEWIENNGLRVFSNILPFDREQARVAGSLAQLTKEKGLSLGDRACLATAIVLDAKLLTADQAWRHLNLGVEILMIRSSWQPRD